MAEVSLRTTSLPWSGEPGEGSRLALALGLMLAIFVPLAIVVPRIQLPEPDRAEVERVPPQLARLLAPRPEPVVIPKPEPAPEPESEPKPRPKPEPKLKPEPKPKPEPAPKPESTPVTTAPPPEPAAVPEPESESPPTPPQTAKEARAVAAKSGLMAMQDQLAAMHQDTAPDSGPIAANVSDGGVATDSQPAKQHVLKGSGGVASHSGPTRDVALADHTVQSVSEPESIAKPATPRPAAHKPGPSQRAMSNIRRVFNRQKAALYALYNRELRKDPTLAGKVLLELVIEPDGTVSRCEVIESELDRPRLEQTIATRVRMFNFGSANVETRTVRFPIDFLPS